MSQMQSGYNTSPSECSDSGEAAVRKFQWTNLQNKSDNGDSVLKPPPPPRQRNHELHLKKQNGYDTKFIVDATQLSHNYICHLCENVCRNAVRLQCSLHKKLNSQYLFCEDCLIGAYLPFHRNMCPLSDATHFHYASFEVATDIRSDIANLSIKCLFSEPGCLWRGKIDDLDEHLFSDCEFKEMKCEYSGIGCGVTVHKNSVQSHNISFMNEHLLLIKDHVDFIDTQNHILQTSVQHKDTQVESLMKTVQCLSDKLRSTTNQIQKLKQKASILETRIDTNPHLCEIAPTHTTFSETRTEPPTPTYTIRDTFSTAFGTVVDSDIIVQPTPLSQSTSQQTPHNNANAIVIIDDTVTNDTVPYNPSPKDHDVMYTIDDTVEDDTEATQILPVTELGYKPNDPYITHWSKDDKSESVDLVSGPTDGENMDNCSALTRAMCYTEHKSMRANHPLLFATNNENGNIRKERSKQVWKIRFNEDSEMDSGFFIGVVSNKSVGFESSVADGTLKYAYGVTCVSDEIYLNSEVIKNCDWKPSIYGGDIVTIEYDTSAMTLRFSLNDEPMIAEPDSKYTIQLPTDGDHIWYPAVSFGKFWGNSYVCCDIFFDT